MVGLVFRMAHCSGGGQRPEARDDQETFTVVPKRGGRKLEDVETESKILRRKRKLCYLQSQ